MLLVSKTTIARFIVNFAANQNTGFVIPHEITDYAARCLRIRKA